MYSLKGALFLLASTYVAAQDLSDVFPHAPRAEACPAAFQELIALLLPAFANDDFPGFQCGDNARAAMRASFHDCAAFDPVAGVGGCDGSLLLTNEVNDNAFDDGLQDYVNLTQSFLQMPQFAGKIGAADLLQFSAAVAIRNCPDGPVVPTFIGRVDSSVESGNVLTFDGHHTADEVLAVLTPNFGLSAEEVGALIGVHTTAEQCDFELDAPEAPQDPTPQLFDVEFFSETFQANASAGVVRFDTDVSLSQHPVAGPVMKSFINNPKLFHEKFVPALIKMGVAGQDRSALTEIDCAAFIPQAPAPPASAKRARNGRRGNHKRSTLNPGCS